MIDAASRACLRAELPLAAAQVVTLNVPGDWRCDTTSAAGDRTLRQYFVAVRTAEDPSQLATLARGGGAGGAQRATASAAAALADDLTRLGYPGPLTVEQAARSLDRRLVPLRYRQQKFLRATLPLALPADA